MKNIFLVIGLLSIPIIFFGQSDSLDFDLPDLTKVVIINDTGFIDDEPIFLVVETMPEYVGGHLAMTNFISTNIQYPVDAYLNQIEGRVIITFVIEKTGKVSDVRKLKGIGYGCDAEAIRIVKQMPDWSPGKQRGIEVRTQFNLPIIFAIDEKVKQQMNEAKEIYTNALKKFDNSQFEKTLVLLNNAIDLHPYFIEGLILRGLVYKELNEVAKACDDWSFAKDLGNDEAEKYIELNCNL